MLKYVQMELDEGLAARRPALHRRGTRCSRGATTQVPIGKDAVYGMGLMVDPTYGTPVVHHGGGMIGYHSDMIWLPEHNVGAVVLTNGDPGWALRERLPAQAPRGALRRPPRSRRRRGRARPRPSSLSSPPIASCSRCRRRRVTPSKLATRYMNDALGSITVSARRSGDRVRFRRVEERGRLAAQSGWDDFVSDDGAWNPVPRVRRGFRPAADANCPRRTTRIRVRGPGRTVVTVTANRHSRVPRASARLLQPCWGMSEFAVDLASGIAGAAMLARLLESVIGRISPTAAIAIGGGPEASWTRPSGCRHPRMTRLREIPRRALPTPRITVGICASVMVANVSWERRLAFPLCRLRIALQLPGRGLAPSPRAATHDEA